MPLTDLGEPHMGGEDMRFYMTDGARRVLVRVSREAVEDADGRSGIEGFGEHRAAFAALATKKYAKGDREPDGSVALRARDV